MLLLSKYVSLNDLLFYPFVMAGVPTSVFRHFTQDVEPSSPRKGSSLCVALVSLHTEAAFSGILGILLCSTPPVTLSAWLRLSTSPEAVSSRRFSATDVTDRGWVYVAPNERQTFSLPTKSSPIYSVTADKAWGAVWQINQREIVKNLRSFMGDWYEVDLWNVIRRDEDSCPFASINPVEEQDVAAL